MNITRIMSSAALNLQEPFRSVFQNLFQFFKCFCSLWKHGDQWLVVFGVESYFARHQLAKLSGNGRTAPVENSWNFLFQIKIKMRLPSNFIGEKWEKMENRMSAINTTLLLLSVCGRRLYPESRVVGGEKSTFGKWPWQVSVVREKKN